MRRAPSVPAASSLACGLLALALLAGPSWGEGLLLEDPKANYSIELPEGWKKLNPADDWGKSGIVCGGVRRLETAGEKPAEGQGALMHLSVLDAPAGKSIDDVANDSTQRQFLLSRFGTDATKWPVPTVKEDKVGPAQDDKGPEVEMRILEVEGTSNNLEGHAQASRGVLIFAIAKGKLLRLRMYAWPASEDDDEGLKTDLDLIEISFRLVDTTEKPKEGEGPPPEAKEPEPVEDEATKERTYEQMAQKWRLKKPKGIKEKEFSPEQNPTKAFWFEGAVQPGIGTYQVYMDVYRNTSDDRPPPDIRKWIGDEWWKMFGASHPKGKVLTYPWPRKTSTGTIVTLPALDDEKAEEVVGEKDKRPEFDFAEMEKRRIIDHPKRPKIGKKVEAQDAYRAVLRGSKDRYGPSVSVRIGWKTATHTYLLEAVLTNEGIGKMQKPIAEMLESLEILEER